VIYVFSFVFAIDALLALQGSSISTSAPHTPEAGAETAATQQQDECAGACWCSLGNPYEGVYFVC
jgi:hypothetical protein